MKKSNWVLGLMVGGSLAATGAQAGPNCDPNDGSTANLKQCMSERYQAADKTLNLVWKSLPSKSSELVSSQKAWVKKRDAKCQEIADAEAGGSLASFEFMGCMTEETIEQTLVLAESLP